jgi:tetratricopeptide (TPR) repeat protein
VEAAAADAVFTRRDAMRLGRSLAVPVLLTLALSGVAFAQEPSPAAAEAKRAFDSGRFKEAGEKYAAAATAGGLSLERQADLHLQSAWAYYIAGNSKSAREQLKLAVTARPELQVIPDFYSPDFANLVSVVRAEVVGANPPPVDLEELKRSSRAKLADGKANEVVYDLKAAAGSNDPDVFRILAEAYDRLGQTADADAARRRATELEKGLVSTAPIGAPPAGVAPTPVAGPITAVVPLLEASEKALAAGDLAGAAAAARQASDSDPRNAAAHRLLGEAALAAGQDSEAEREFTAAIVLEPGNARAVFGLASLAEREKKWNTAAGLYRRALDLNPQDVAAARGLGRAMNEIGEKTAARIAFGRAVEIDPASAGARNDFGVFLFEADEVDRAVQELIEAVRLDSSRPDYHANLGLVFARKGMWKEADRELSETTRLSPNDTVAWIALGHTRAAEHEPEQAASAFSAALALDPLSEEAATALAAILADSGRLADAEAALSRAMQENAKSPALWNNLGVLRTRLGQYAAAVEAFDRALALDAGSPDVRSNRARAVELAALEASAS